MPGIKAIAAMVAKLQFKIESIMTHKEIKADSICNFAEMYSTANMVNH